MGTNQVIRDAEAGVVNALAEAGRMFALALEGMRRTWDVRQWWWEFIEQCWFLTRVTAIPVFLVSLPLGATIALQVGEFTRQLGAQSATGGAVILGLVREVAPIASAILIAGAGGSAMTSDMGARNIREELDAMEVMGINPIHRLVTPRIWASSLVAVLLVPLVILSGAVGGYYFNVVQQHVTPGAYWDGATALLVLPDLLTTLFKACIFGLVAGIVACHMGMNCKRSPIGVGRAVNKATVTTLLIVVAINYVLTTMYIVIQPPRIA